LGQAWLAAQSANHYTLQLSNSLRYDGVLALKQQLNSQEAYIVEQTTKGQTSYLLLLGYYATREQALASASNLSLNTPPWIRSFNSFDLTPR
jgi:septal ring-binding cell division protein DamX